MSTESAPVEPQPRSLAVRAKRTVKTVRWWMIVPLPLLVIVVNALVGVDGLQVVITKLLWLSWVCIIVAVVHAFRKALFNYADMRKAWDRAVSDPVGAGLAFLGLCFVIGTLFLGMAGFAHAQDVKTYIPANARPLLPVLKKTQEEHWPGMAYPSYFGALIEQESCISLTHSKCWNSSAQLKTAREEGGGLGQFTRAYTASGALRFDAIAEVKQLDPALKEFNWSTVYTRADLSMLAIIAKIHDMARRMSGQTSAEPFDVLAFVDSGYNGGASGVEQDRNVCNLKPGCDPQKWFGHVELTSTKSRTPWQGYGKSAYAISREHVFNTLKLRRPKYEAALGADLL